MIEITTEQALALLDQQLDAAKADLENTIRQWQGVENRDTREVINKESADLEAWEGRHKALLRGVLNLGDRQARISKHHNQVSNRLFRLSMDLIDAAKEAKENANGND